VEEFSTLGGALLAVVCIRIVWNLVLSFLGSY